ncbi:MAG: hypothetical protein KC493_12665 [Bacteriovoracaceae bacterium]|nr:hypothetical protein [Bacteriovoracaceae bacterium]
MKKTAFGVVVLLKVLAAFIVALVLFASPNAYSMKKTTQKVCGQKLP